MVQQRTVECEGHTGAQRKAWPSTAAMSSCHWILTFKAESVGSSLCSGFSTIISFTHRLHCRFHPLTYTRFIPVLSHPSPSRLKPCGDGGSAKQQVEVTTGSCSLHPAGRWPWTLVVHPYIRGNRGVRQHPWRLSSPIKDNTAHPSKGGTLVREGPRKGGLKIACPLSI